MQYLPMDLSRDGYRAGCTLVPHTSVLYLVYRNILHLATQTEKVFRKWKIFIITACTERRVITVLLL